MSTKVLFLIERDSEDVFAYFPEIFGDASLSRYIMSAYSHIGQHSACRLSYAMECKQATTNQYLPLLNELIGQGYNDLLIMNSQEIECHRQPTKAEIKFGEGAIHYRSFPLSVIGLKKGKSEWKDWFIAPDDGLRYYTR